MDWGHFLLLIFGLIIAIAGWFCDRLSHFPFLELLVARRARYALDGLHLLATNDRHGLLPAHPGFREIITAWPGLSPSSSVAVIGRSVAFMEFGPTVGNHFELIVRSADNVEFPPRWRYAPAVELFKRRIEKRVFWFGTVVFWAGIAVSLVAGLLDFLPKA